jgi:hypothetical protein
MLAGERTIDGVLDGIGGDDDAVVSFGVAGGKLVSGLKTAIRHRGGTYEVSMSPSSRTQTVVSFTVCTPVFSSR